MHFKINRMFILLLWCCAHQAIGQNYNLVQRSYMDWPGQTLANICGWTSPTGKEYALLGGSKGLIIVDISNPDAPNQIVQIPGPNNLWKEIKVYKHYAYVTSEGGQGLQIVDLSALPSPNLVSTFYTGSGALAGQLNAIHALHIDTTKGVVYLFGGGQNGATLHKIAADPMHPEYLGSYLQGGYVHDGYANNDTLYAAHIYAGTMHVVDCSNPASPVQLGSVNTPTNFTHNAWPSTSNRHILFTTDETDNSYLAAYDTKDPNNIIELDRFQTTPGSNSIVHNTHVLNDYAVTSWYKDGFDIVDVSRPNNLIEVASFDTYPIGNGAGFDGCWGVFPFFPSGTIVSSNIGSNDPNDPARLYVLTPTYKRACYLEGVVTDGCNGLPLANADIKIISNNPTNYTKSLQNGVYRTGQVTPGSFSVTISKSGYNTITKTVTLAAGQVTPLNITLEKGTTYNVACQARIGTQALQNQEIYVITPTGLTEKITTNAQGTINLNCAQAGNYTFGFWGGKEIITKSITSAAPITLNFTAGYYDDATLDYGWVKEATSTTGLWVRDIPIGTDISGVLMNPNTDAAQDTNAFCYMTGNGGGQVGNDDVDGGFVSLTSPITKLAQYTNPILSFQYWFANAAGQSQPNDYFEVRATNGTQTAVLFRVDSSASVWRQSPNINIKDKITLSNNMYFTFYTSDDDPGHVVEAAVDMIQIKEGTSATTYQNFQANMVVSPNPFNSTASLAYTDITLANAQVEITNVQGLVLETKPIIGQTGQILIGKDLPSGIYFVRLRNAEAVSSTVKIAKI